MPLNRCFLHVGAKAEVVQAKGATFSACLLMRMSNSAAGSIPSHLSEGSKVAIFSWLPACYRQDSTCYYPCRWRRYPFSTCYHIAVYYWTFCFLTNCWVGLSSNQYPGCCFGLNCRRFLRQSYQINYSKRLSYSIHWYPFNQCQWTQIHCQLLLGHFSYCCLNCSFDRYRCCFR